MKKKIIELLNKTYKRKTLNEKVTFKKVLFLRPDRIGDMIITTPAIRAFKEKYPDTEIDILASRHNHSVVGNNQNIHKIFVYEKNLLMLILLILKIRREKYDLIVDFNESDSLTSLIFLILFHGKYTAGHFKDKTKIYDFVGSKIEKVMHITEKNNIIMSLFGADASKYPYEIPLTDDERLFAKEYFRNIPERRNIILNRYSSTEPRSISLEKFSEIIKKITAEINDINLLISCPRGKKEELQLIIKKINNSNVYLMPETDTILKLCALIELSDVIITPDTSLVHIASAFNKSLIAIYNGHEKSFMEWKALHKKAHAVRCIGSDSINNIDVDEIAKLVKKSINEEY